MGKIKNAKKTIYDGIEFKSDLERYMYQLLKESGLEASYEPHRYKLIDGFECSFDVWENKPKKKELIQTQKVYPMSYTPDFVGDTFIIETKGYGNDAFPLRWKLFKLTMQIEGNTKSLFMPRNQTQCREVIQKIKEIQCTTTKSSKKK